MKIKMKIKKLFCRHLVHTLMFPIRDETNVYFYHCIKCDKYFSDTPLLMLDQWLD